MKVTYSPKSNFHNSAPLNLRFRDSSIVLPIDGSALLRLSSSQLRRVINHFCGVSGCSCGSAGVMELEQGTMFISIDDCIRF